MFLGTWALFLLDMIRDYTYYNYQPDYGFKLYQEDKLIDSSEQVQGAACFARVFRNLERESNDKDFRKVISLMTKISR